MSLSKTTAITHPGTLAGLGTLLLALVAVALFFGCREARRPWPPLRDADGRRIVEKEVGGEKVSKACSTT
jgi:protein-S-isoprenylcysteine O-methyltransferase Ste14